MCPAKPVAYVVVQVACPCCWPKAGVVESIRTDFKENSRMIHSYLSEVIIVKFA